MAERPRGRAVVLLGAAMLAAAAAVYLRVGHGPQPAAAASAPAEEAPAAPDVAAAAADTDLATPAPAPAATLATAPTDGLSAADQAVVRQVLAHFATGDYVRALRIADDHALVETGSEALHEWILAQLPVLLTSAGWTRLKLGDCDEATQYLRRAEALKRSPETAKGLAVCYYKQKNVAAAREQFSYYLDKNGDDAQMLFLFADALESEGSYEEAVRALERAAELPPDAARIDPTAIPQRLASMRARAKESGFQNAETSRNFRLAYRAGDHEDLVAFVLQTLEDALDEYIESYGFQPPAAPIEVVLYPAGDFRGIVVGGPEWAEGLFDGRLRIPIRDQQLAARQYGSLPVVLRHELVHALLSLQSDGRQIPSWFDEGMAQRLACGVSGCGDFAYPASPGQFLAAAAFSSPYTSFDAVKAGRAYRQSLFLVEVVERRYGQDALRQLVGGIGRATDLTSDGLLRPHGLGFRDLHTLSAGLWNGRRSPDAAQAR